MKLSCDTIKIIKVEDSPGSHFNQEMVPSL
jgi:hypothetical protein